MCIIAVKPKDAKMFSDKEIKTMFYNNDDGAGFVYNKNGVVKMEKGFFKVDNLLKRLHSINFDGCDLIIHFRIGTSGKLDKNNCHPFKIKNNLYFAHNGILSEYADAKSDKSDTALFCDKVLKKIDSEKIFNDKTIEFLIKEIIGGSNKLAFINSNGFHLVGNFIKDDGRYYSNNTYVESRYPFSYSTLPSYQGAWYDDYDDEMGKYYNQYYNDYKYIDLCEEYYDCDRYDDVLVFNNIEDLNDFRLSLTDCGNSLYMDDDCDYWKINDKCLEAKIISYDEAFKL